MWKSGGRFRLGRVAEVVIFGTTPAIGHGGWWGSRGIVWVGWGVWGGCKGRAVRLLSVLVRLVHSLFQHAVVVSHHGGQLGVQIQERFVLRHGLTQRSRQFRAELADALVQLLYLRFAQDCSGGLVLEAVHERREEVDVLGLDVGQLVLVLGHDKWLGRIDGL